MSKKKEIHSGDLVIIELSKVSPLKNEVDTKCKLPCLLSASYSPLNASSFGCLNINCTMFEYGT